MSAVEGLHLAAILQRHGSEAQQAYPNARVVRSLDELLAIDSIRLVVIATPNTTHFDLARQCLLAGRDVVIDKPFTTTYAEAAELVALASDQEASPLRLSESPLGRRLRDDPTVFSPKTRLGRLSSSSRTSTAFVRN